MSPALDQNRRRFLGMAAMTLASAPFALFGSPVRLPIEGELPALHNVTGGSDVNATGQGTVDEARMYHLIRQQKPIVDRRLKIEFLDPGVEPYSFTFG